MEDLSWETNMWLPWNNINHHQQETFTFGSQNIFSNPIQRLSKTDSTTYMNPITPSFESLDCLPSATNSNNADTSSDHDDGISVIFPDYNSSHDSIINNPNAISSGEYSVTKENTPRSKKLKLDPGRPGSSTINFRQGTTTESDETDSEAIAQMKEMIYRAAAFRPVSFAGEEVTEKPRRRNVRISSDPQTVAARQRREKISERIRVLQKLVPGGNKMDTASMLDEAASYLKFLRSQVKALEQFGQKIDYVKCGTSSNAESTTSQLMVGNNIGANVTVGVPLIPMQTHFLVPHQQVYPTPPPA